MITLFTGTGTTIRIDNSSDSLFTPWDDVLHRGWHEGVPENTLPAYYLIARNGYHWGECDIRLSLDGHPVLAHDSTLTGTVDGVSTTMTVAESSVEELKTLVLANHSQFGPICPCTLTELLELAKHINIGIVLDIKSASNTVGETFYKNLAKTVVASGWADHVVYMPAAGINSAKWIQEIDRNASFDFVTSIYTSNKETFLSNLAGYRELLTGANTVGFDLNASSFGGEEVITAIHGEGLSVSFWNVNNTNIYPHGPLRVTYTGYKTAHLGRDYIQQKQTELDAKYANG